MNHVNSEQHILQAIKHVRERKARPDLPRICSQIKKTLRMSKEEAVRVTRQALDRMLDKGTVIKVQYKKDLTYRDAAKWTTTKGRANGKIISPVNLVAKIQAAIDGIVQQKTANTNVDGRVNDNVNGNPKSETGATVEEIEQWFSHFQDDDEKNGCLLRGSVLLDVLTREMEVDIQTIKKTSNGTFAVGKRVEPQELKTCSVANTEIVGLDSENTLGTESGKSETQQPQSQNMLASAVADECEETTSPKRQRPPSTRKRISKYDEGLYEILPMKKKQKLIPKQEPTKNGDCSDAPIAPQYRLAAMFRECHELHLNIPGRHDNALELLTCCGCKLSAHPSCLNFSPELVARINVKTWRCITCKKCAWCNVALRTPLPLTCSGCDLAYHKACHAPVVREKGVPDNWLCMYCTERAAQKTEEAQNALVNGASNHCSNGDSKHCAEDVEDKSGEEEDDSRDSIGHSSAEKSAEKDSSLSSTPRDSPTDDSRRANNSPGPAYIEMEPTPISRHDGLEYPDPIDWSADQVYEFIVSQGDVFIEGAEALRKQKIDGEALVLLKREDFINRCGVSLGPALKLHRLVANMTTNGCAHLFRRGHP